MIPVSFIEDKKNYHRFAGIALFIAKKHVPCGFRKKYITRWTKECQRLYEQFLNSRYPEIGDSLLTSFDSTRMNKWKSTVELFDFTRSSRKEWEYVNRQECSNRITIDQNRITNRIAQVSRASFDKTHEIFVLDEINKAVSQINTGRGAGFDEV